jgi:hypothetical protein
MEPMFQASEPQIDGAAKLPVLLVFDVNETLSDMAPARRAVRGSRRARSARRTLVCRVASRRLRAHNRRRECALRRPAGRGLRMQLSGASIDRDLAQVSTTSWRGSRHFRSTPMCPTASADLPIWAFAWSRLPTARPPLLSTCCRRPVSRTVSSRSYRWSRPASGSRRAMPTPMVCARYPTLRGMFTLCMACMPGTA